MAESVAYLRQALDVAEARIAFLEKLLVQLATAASMSTTVWTQCDAEVSRILAKREDLRPRPYKTNFEKAEAGEQVVGWRHVSVGPAMGRVS